MLKELFDAIKELLKLFNIKTKKQTETLILKTVKKSYKQEDLILDMASLIQKYMENFAAYDRFKAKCYLKKIKKVN